MQEASDRSGPGDRWHAVRTLGRALRPPTMRRLLVAFFLFRTTEMATWIALLVWAFDRGGATASGVIAVAQLIPATLAAPLGSVLADRGDRPTALRMSYLLQAGTSSLAAAGLFLAAPFWGVALLAGIMASTMTLTRPVHHALVPEIARTPDELTAGNTASTAAEGLASFAGPAVAGGLLVVGSAGWVFVAMWFVCLLAFAVTHRVEVVQRSTPAHAASYRSDVVEGLRTVVREPAAGVLTLVAGGHFVVRGLLDVLAVVLAIEVLGTGHGGPGILSSGVGGGALVGVAVAVTLIGRRRLAPPLVASMVLTGAMVAAVAIASSFVVALLLFMAAGAAIAYLDVAARSLLQRNLTPRVLARVFGLHEGLLMAGTAVGSGVVPVLIALLGVPRTFIAAGLLLPALALGSWRWLRRVDRDVVLPSVALAHLRRLPMFAALSPPQLESLAAQLQPIPTVPPGADVVVQGESGDRYYLITAGDVEVLRDGHRVATLTAGDGFGEIALLRDVPRTATVRALGRLELVALDREPFLLAVTGSDESYRLVDATVAERLPSEAGSSTGPDAGRQGTKDRPGG